MSNDTDQHTYTLDEARRELARQECASHGHSWRFLTKFDGTPVQITCETCGRTGSVTMDPA